MGDTMRSTIRDTRYENIVSKDLLQEQPTETGNIQLDDLRFKIVLKDSFGDSEIQA
jgi:hypothetical protein